MEQDNITVARRAFQAFNTGEYSQLAEFISPDYLNYEALDDDDERSRLNGPAEFQASANWMRSVYADLHFEEQEMIAQCDKIAARVIMTGKHVGDFMGIAPTGKTISVQQVHIFQIV